MVDNSKRQTDSTTACFQSTDAGSESIPECFGNLEIVFPMGVRGLRETPDNCMYLCAYKTSCLRKAMAGLKGIDVREEMVERGEKAGVIGFFERWSRKKSLAREKKDKWC